MNRRQADGRRRPVVHFRPPFDLTSDLLLALGACRSAPLRAAFPDVPFASLFGWSPLLIWFARVTQSCYDDPRGVRHCDGPAEGGAYNEVTIMALLRRGWVFVPAILASGERTVRIARHYYGMPKCLARVSMETRGRRLRARAASDGRLTEVVAFVIGQGTTLGSLLGRRWPTRGWGARFPGGGAVQPELLAAPRIHLALLQGQVALEPAWLPRAAWLLPLGVFARGLRMRLPPPEVSIDVAR